MSCAPRILLGYPQSFALSSAPRIFGKISLQNAKILDYTATRLPVLHFPMRFHPASAQGSGLRWQTGGRSPGVEMVGKNCPSVNLRIFAAPPDCVSLPPGGAGMLFHNAIAVRVVGCPCKGAGAIE